MCSSDLHGEVDSLSHVAEVRGLKEIHEQFPERTPEELCRPHGEVDLLIGIDRVDIHPAVHMTQDHLRLCSSVFGTGWAIGGTIPGTEGYQKPQFPEVHHVQQLSADAELFDESTKFLTFYEAEDLAYASPRDCSSCRGFQDCRLLIQLLTLDDKLKGWNEPLPPEHADKWATYITQVLSMPAFTYPRSIFPVGDSSPWLITFCDASQLAMGTACYVRWIDVTGIPQVRLVIAKTRLAPSKVLSIPKLELHALAKIGRAHV